MILSDQLQQRRSDTICADKDGVVFKFRVTLTECDGWSGTKIMSIWYYKSEQEANRFVAAFNKDQGLGKESVTPTYYIRADSHGEVR